MSARILVEAYFGLFGVGVLIDGCNHLTNPLRRLAIELRVEVAVIDSSDEGGDDLCFCDIGNIIPYLKKASDVAMKELRRLLVDVVEIMLGARPSTRSHVVVGEYLLELFLGSDGARGETCEPVHRSWCKHDGKIVHHDAGISPGGTHSSGISL